MKITDSTRYKSSIQQKRLFNMQIGLQIRKKLVKCYIWSIDSYGAKFGRFEEQVRNTLKVLKYGVGGCRRSVGANV
jgi:hypothetical protein